MFSYLIATQHPAFYLLAAAGVFFVGYMAGLYGYSKADRAGYVRALSNVARQDAERGL